jgi:putative ABC transport system permease protein
MQGFDRIGNIGGLGNLFGGGSATAVEYIDTIDAAVSLGVLLQLIGIGIALAVVSSLAGIIFVLRYEPLRILAERA